MNKTAPYDDAEIRRIIRLASLWLEGYPEVTADAALQQQEYASLAEYALQTAESEHPDPRLDEETLSTLRLIAFMEREAKLSLDEIEIPDRVSSSLEEHIHQLASSERGRRNPIAGKLLRWGAAAAVAAIAITGGLRLTTTSIPDFPGQPRNSVLAATDPASAGEGNIATVTTPAVTPPEKSMAPETTPTSSEAKKRVSGKRKRAAGRSVITNPAPEDTSPNTADQAIGEEISHASIERTREEIKRSFGLIAQQTAEVSRTVEENLDIVTDIFQALHSNIAKVNNDIERASAAAPTSATMTPPTNIITRPATADPRGI